MITSFADGTKIAAEMGVVANATGFGVAERGMAGPRASRVEEAPERFDIESLLDRPIVDYLIGADFSLGADTRLYAYGFQRRFVQYDSDIVPDRVETGGTIQLTHKFSDTLELQALFITSFNRNDWMFQPRATWNFARNWRMNVGLDILHGPQLGFFGRFGNRDRIYTNVRYSF